LAGEPGAQRNHVDRRRVLEKDGVGGRCCLRRADVKGKEQSEQQHRYDDVPRAWEAASSNQRQEPGGGEEAAKESDAESAGIDLLDEEATAAPEEGAGEQVEACDGGREDGNGWARRR